MACMFLNIFTMCIDVSYSFYPTIEKRKWMQRMVTFFTSLLAVHLPGRRCQMLIDPFSACPDKCCARFRFFWQIPSQLIDSISNSCYSEGDSNNV